VINFLLKLISLLGRNKQIAILMLVLLPIAIELPMILSPQTFLKTVKRPGNEASVYPIDTEMYANYVQYFRGLKHKGEGISVPYTYRPLTPILASFLPIDSPIYSLIVLNLLFIYLTMYALYSIAKVLQLDFSFSVFAALLYSFSFPVFYFSPLGLVDVVCLFFICLGIYSVLSEKFWLFSISLVLGIYSKESILILIPFAVIYYFQKYGWQKKFYLYSITSLLLYLVNFYIIRNYFAFNDSFYWYIEIDAFWANLFRRGTNIGSLLTFGLPGILSLIFIGKSIRNKASNFKSIIPWAFGFMSALGLYAFAYFSAFADGRFVWYVYPFAIPMSLLYLSQKKSSNTFLT